LPLGALWIWFHVYGSIITALVVGGSLSFRVINEMCHLNNIQWNLVYPDTFVSTTSANKSCFIKTETSYIREFSRERTCPDKRGFTVYYTFCVTPSSLPPWIARGNRLYVDQVNMHLSDAKKLKQKHKQHWLYGWISMFGWKDSTLSVEQSGIGPCGPLGWLEPSRVGVMLHTITIPWFPSHHQSSKSSYHRDSP